MIRSARCVSETVFQKAEANDLVRRNPVRLAEKMRASGTAKRKEAFTTAEVAHLMKVLPDDRMGLSIRLLLGTGMRMQELLALSLIHIYFLRAESFYNVATKEIDYSDDDHPSKGYHQKSHGESCLLYTSRCV